jgi:lipid-A-disaccharide synthase
MPDPLRLFVLAGEPSGDRIAAALVRRLAARTSVELSGVGGSALQSVGLASLFPMHELSVMGWADVLPRLPRLLWRAAQVARHIARTEPDIAVFVDAQAFSAVAARGVRRRGSSVPLVLYVAPAVWAWKPERAAALRGRFDEVLAVLPFEPAVMAKLGGPPTSYVGHPAVAEIAPRAALPGKGPLLLLPGSRAGELRRHLPIMRAMAERFEGHAALTGFVIPTPTAMRDRLTEATSSWPVPATIVSEEDDKRGAFSDAIAAVAVTGTVTLELALAGVPMVTTYVADQGQAKRWTHYAIKYAALPNILLDRPLVPEILGVEPQPAAVGDALETLLGGGAAEQLDGFAEVHRLMRDGTPDAPPVDAAERILARARSYRSPIGR